MGSELASDGLMSPLRHHRTPDNGPPSPLIRQWLTTALAQLSPTAEHVSVFIDEVTDSDSARGGALQPRLYSITPNPVKKGQSQVPEVVLTGDNFSCTNNVMRGVTTKLLLSRNPYQGGPKNWVVVDAAWVASGKTMRWIIDRNYYTQDANEALQIRNYDDHTGKEISRSETKNLFFSGWK